MTSSTTADKRVPFSRILLLSVLLQAAGGLVFYFAEPLRKTVLKAEEQARDAQALDREAASRLRRVEEQRRRQREQTGLKREDAERIARRAEREKATDMAEKLRAMQAIRQELKLDQASLLQDLSERTVADVSLHFHDRLHPLATQLVENARNQREQVPLPAAPSVLAASESLRDLAERERVRLLEDEVFERLRAAHGEVQAAQHRYISELDAAQATYPQDQERIRRENHIEFLVNLLRDQIAGLLGETAALDVAAMNDLPPDFAPPGELPADWSERLDQLPVPELHETAQALYEDIRRLFAGARAAALALEQHTSMTQAYASVNLPAAATAYQPGGAAGPPQTLGELNRQAAQLAQAARDVAQLWQQAHNMGAAGRAMAGRGGPDAGGGRPDAGAAGGAGRGRGGVGAASAAEGRAGRYADMTPFMYAGGGGGERGFGSGNAGGSDITARSIRSGYAETGAGTPGAKGPPLLSEQKVIKEALPGRTFSRTSPRTGWLYLDTWYVIGPWENRSRVAFDRTWPPETLVDLDATYEGKGGRRLAWQFHQSDNIRVKPPDEEESSTYYAYTEVFFEEEMEMLLAVASDDAAKVWLNDQLIWRDDGIGPWRLDEGFRKVVFRQGFNTLLVRVENGPITCTYSLLLCPPEVLQ
jgi:hypothetical protein